MDTPIDEINALVRVRKQNRAMMTVEQRVDILTVTCLVMSSCPRQFCNSLLTLWRLTTYI